jgi:thiol-disulfide isomerase/thioredoxin
MSTIRPFLSSLLVVTALAFTAPSTVLAEAAAAPEAKPAAAATAAAVGTAATDTAKAKAAAEQKADAEPKADAKAEPKAAAEKPAGNPLLPLAECIKASGAKFYGAHWCGYCRKQKATFGDAAKALPYIECYELGTKNKLDKCKEVRGFPSWEFADGKSRRGALSAQALAAATGCSMTGTPAATPAAKATDEPAKKAVAAKAAADPKAAAAAPAPAAPIAPTQEELVAFAQCIDKSGAKFYGAHWCGYCRKQKATFGDAAKALPYIECYELGTKNKLDKCKDVRGFPSWTFGNGTTRRGALSLQALAGATECAMPGSAAAEPAVKAPAEPAKAEPAKKEEAAKEAADPKPAAAAPAPAPAVVKAPTQEKLVEFAKCIDKSGAKFYGAHWCGYCRKQKAAFGAASKSLPYIECYELGTKNKLDKCKEVKGFPTWEFGNGKTRRGALSLQALAAATECPAP